MATQVIYYKHPELKTGKEVSIEIYREAVLIDSGTMSEIGGGLYYYNFVVESSGQFMAYMSEDVFCEEKTIEI